MGRAQLIGLGAAAAALVVGGVVFAVVDRREPAAPPPPIGSTEPLADGVYRIGIDIAAGKWRTDGPRDIEFGGIDGMKPIEGMKSQCLYRLWYLEERDRKPYHDHQVLNGPEDVELANGVVQFETAGCAPWQHVG